MKRMRIEFEANFGGVIEKCSLSQPPGGGDDFFIMIGKWYHGTLAFRNEEWVGYLAAKSELTSADIRILGEMVDAELAKEKDQSS